MITLTHIGNNFPNYINICLQQIRRYNSSVPIFFITNLQHVNSNLGLWKQFNVVPINSDELKNDRMDYFERVLGNGWSEFWTKSATRILYLEEFIKINNQPILHFENDVLIYSDLLEILEKSKQAFPKMGLTKGGEDRFMTGMFFIKNYESLNDMTDHWIRMLSEKNKLEICMNYGLDMIHEMSLFLVYHVDKGEEYLGTYPTLPNHQLFPLFNSLFDPATYGQYIGGLPEAAGGAPPGFIDGKHIIGKYMNENKGKWEILFKNNIPYFVIEKDEFRLNNLHIHSKKLELFNS